MSLAQLSTHTRSPLSLPLLASSPPSLVCSTFASSVFSFHLSLIFAPFLSDSWIRAQPPCFLFGSYCSTHLNVFPVSLSVFISPTTYQLSSLLSLFLLLFCPMKAVPVSQSESFVFSPPKQHMHSIRAIYSQSSPRLCCSQISLTSGSLWPIAHRPDSPERRDVGHRSQ